jgi:hypothetical protein
MKQMYERNTDDEPLSLAGVMVLAITLKNACQFGWFRKNGAEQVLTIVDEIKKKDVLHHEKCNYRNLVILAILQYY